MTVWFVVLLVVFGLFKIIVTSMPNSFIESLSKKFELHPTLKEDEVTIKRNDKEIQGEEKSNILHAFNDATFVERYYFPPQNHTTAIVIYTKKNVIFSLYQHEEHIDVIKQYKKKIVGYRILSKTLPTFFEK